MLFGILSVEGHSLCCLGRGPVLLYMIIHLTLSCMVVHCALVVQVVYHALVIRIVWAYYIIYFSCMISTLYHTSYIIPYIVHCTIHHTLYLVSEPDPQKIEKEGLAHRLGWKCTLRNVRNFINCWTLQSL